MDMAAYIEVVQHLQPHSSTIVGISASASILIDKKNWI